MRRAAAIAIAAAIGAGLATAYLERERAATPAPAPLDADVPARATLAPGVTTESSPADAPPAPSVATPRSGAPTEPAELAPPLAADDSVDPRSELAVEHDGDFATSYLRVAERFRDEPRDPTAAVALEREILDRFAAMTGLELTTLDVECRTTTCRVRMIERPGSEFREVGGPGFQSIGQGFGATVGTTRVLEDGSTIFEWLLARDAAATQ